MPGANTSGAALEVVEPDPYEKHPLTASEQQKLRRALAGHDLAPLRLPGILDGPPICSGYSNCCCCPRCLERQKQARANGFTREGKIAAPPEKPQPWEARAA